MKQGTIKIEGGACNGLKLESTGEKQIIAQITTIRSGDRMGMGERDG